MSIGETIRKIRKEKGMTQKELAKKLGTTPQNIAQYETGKRNAKQETLQKIADALEVDVCELITAGLNIETDSPDMIKRLLLYQNALKAPTTNKDHERKKQKSTVYFDGTEYTEDELEEIYQFAEFVKSKRKKSDTE